jgi:hypothetical protein
MSKCGQQFINTQCNYVDDITCQNKCLLYQLKTEYNKTLQEYFMEYSNYLQLKFGTNATEQTKTNADTNIKPKVISLNTTLNNILSELKNQTLNIQNTINNQEKIISSKNKDIKNKNDLINNQLELINQKENELNSKHRMLTTGIERNKYKRNVTYLFIIVIISMIIIIGNILLKRR